MATSQARVDGSREMRRSDSERPTPGSTHQSEEWVHEVRSWAMCHQLDPDVYLERQRQECGKLLTTHNDQQKSYAIACETAGKRLCSDDEWVTACKGKQPTTYPYGKEHKAKRCNDDGISSLHRVFGKLPSQELYGYDSMNDPRLNKLSRTVAKTGARKLKLSPRGCPCALVGPVST